jgi:hypothetical protein
MTRIHNSLMKLEELLGNVPQKLKKKKPECKVIHHSIIGLPLITWVDDAEQLKMNERGCLSRNPHEWIIKVRSCAMLSSSCAGDGTHLPSPEGVTQLPPN